MRLRELLEFRTPQHPSSGTNNWGGASPLLTRNIPQESLEQRYLRLNSTRTDNMFADDHFMILSDQTQPPRHQCPRKPTRRGLLSKLLWPQKKAMQEGTESNQKNRWFPLWDPQKRWPQGWC